MTSGYYLVSKITKLPYYKYKGNPLRLINQTARTVNEVVVRSKNNSKLERKITTFYNSNGDIIERVLDFSDKPYRNRIYKKKSKFLRISKSLTEFLKFKEENMETLNKTKKAKE